MTAIIVGGSPRSGKTSLGIYFKKHGWEHREFDVFKFFLEHSVQDSPSLNRLWPYSSVSVWDREGSAEAIFDHYLATMELMERGLKGVFEKINMEGNSIIECTYISPKLLSELQKKWPGISTVCIGIDDEKKAEECIMQGLQNNPNDWIHTIGIQHVEKVIKTVVIFSHYIQKECSKYGIEFINYKTPRDIWVQEVYETLLQARQNQP